MTENAQLVAELKDAHGRGASRRLRRAGRIPAIVYGSAGDAVSVTLDHNTVYYALKREEFHTSILKMKIDGKVEKVLLRDFQMHAFRPEVLHADFMRVNEKEEIQIRIPLHFINEDTAFAVKSQGAHITHVVTEVEIRALAKNIPHFIEVDLKEIKAGQSVHLSDLVLPKGVALVSLLRGDDAPVVVAAGIVEVEESNEVISVSDIPTIADKKDDAE